MNGPHLASIRLHPIKSLDGISVTACRIGPGGGLEMDRAWALHSGNGQCITGKSSAAIHRIRATFAPDLGSVTLAAPDTHRPIAPATIAFPQDTVLAGDWFRDYFERPVVVRYSAEGFPDDMIRNGPLVVSTGTLRTVAGWFPGIDLEESRRRFRAPLEIDGVDPFWEDQLFRVHERDAVPFTIGDVRLEGVNPCPRCAVPGRDTMSGIELTGFQKRFSEFRQAHYPSWACQPDRIKHFYHLGINTLVAATEHGKWLRVGDPVRRADAAP